MNCNDRGAVKTDMHGKNGIILKEDNENDRLEKQSRIFQVKPL